MVTSTSFQHPPKHEVTYREIGVLSEENITSSTHAEIDYFITSQQWKMRF